MPCPTYLVWGSHTIGEELPGGLWFHSEAQQKTTRQWSSASHSHTPSSQKLSQQQSHTAPLWSARSGPTVGCWTRSWGPYILLGHVKALAVNGGDLHIVSIRRLKSLVPARIIGPNVGESLYTSTRRPIFLEHIGQFVVIGKWFVQEGLCYRMYLRKNIINKK